MGALKIDEVLDSFMKRLEDNNLIIVEKNDFIAQSELLKQQKKLLKKSALTIYEVHKYELLPFTINGMKTSSQFLEGERYKTSKNKWMIATSAIIRLRKKLEL